MLYLLLRPPLLNMMLRTRISPTGGVSVRVLRRLAHRVRSLVVRASILLMTRLVVLRVVVSRHLSASTAWLQIDVDAALVVLGVVL